MSQSPTHTIVETSAYTGKTKRLGVSEAELAEIYDIYATNPGYGLVERGTGGLRKGRVAKEETGKSGGYRVFSFFASAADPVFLLWMIDKTDDDSLTDEQKKKFKKLIAELKKELRK